MTTPQPSDEELELQRSLRFSQLPVNTYAAGFAATTIMVPVSQQPFDVPDTGAGVDGADGGSD